MKTNLQKLRKEAGFKSAKAFAEYIDMKPGTYTDYEQGRTSMTIERAWEFADIFECTLDELAGRKWPSSDAKYEDPEQARLNEYYEKMNESGKTLLVESAKSISADPERRIIKDGQEHLDDTGAIGA